MDSAAIVKKLKEFLQSHSRFEEECEVVYLMVEIRKILDFKEAENFATLRFYYNWVLHNKLNRKYTTDILAQKFSINNIDQLGAREIARKFKSGHSTFFTLNDFKNELEKLFKVYQLPTVLLNNRWAKFRKLFLEIIIECPIIFTSDKLHSLELKKKDDENYEYKFSLLTHNRNKPVIKLKFKKRI